MINVERREEEKMLGVSCRRGLALDDLHRDIYLRPDQKRVSATPAIRTSSVAQSSAYIQLLLLSFGKLGVRGIDNRQVDRPLCSVR